MATKQPTYADLKAQQIDREIAAHTAEIKRLKARKAQYTKLAAKAPAADATTDQTQGAAD